jgi:hypothetical protein
MATVEALATSSGSAMDASNDRLAKIMANAENLSAGQLMAALTKEQAITAFIQAFFNQQKKLNEFVGRLA